MPFNAIFLTQSSFGSRRFRLELCSIFYFYHGQMRPAAWTESALRMLLTQTRSNPQSAPLPPPSAFFAE